MITWRSIIDGAREGGLNMAIDYALLLAAEQTPDVPQTVLRIYKWAAPTLSLGYAQKPTGAANPFACRRYNVPLVRRPTGGRAVLHDQELTYAIVSNDPRCFHLLSSRQIYEQIAQALQRGLEQVGVIVSLSVGAERVKAATLAGTEGNYLRMRLPCFTSPARHELLCGRRKIIGSAQRRLRSAFLQHGSLLLDCNFPLLAAVTQSEEGILRRSITSVATERGGDVSEGDVTAALCSGFEEYFEVSLTNQTLSDRELATSGALAPSYRIKL